MEAVVVTRCSLGAGEANRLRAHSQCHTPHCVGARSRRLHCQQQGSKAVSAALRTGSLRSRESTDAPQRLAWTPGLLTPAPAGPPRGISALAGLNSQQMLLVREPQYF